jgi:hypothetical protein
MRRATAIKAALEASKARPVAHIGTEESERRKI